MVIDIHTHTFPDKLAAPTIRKLQGACHTRAFTDATNAGLAASMARAGIDCSVVLPVATNPHQVAHVNESAAQINARGRGTGIYSFGCIHPDCPDPRGELARIAALGLKGIKLHPAYQATRYLLDNGHRRIAALITCPDDHSISQLRYEGYTKALAEAGIPLDESLVICTGTFNIQDSYTAMNRVLDSGADFSAVFAISDNMAIGAMRALREHGRTVPDGCSVVAIDGIEVSDYIDPPLTTLCQPMEEMGRRSIQILLDMIEGRSGNCHEVLPTVLRPGGSVKTLV